MRTLFAGVVAAFAVLWPSAAATAEATQAIAIDLATTGHAYQGFGAQIWPGDPRIEHVIEALGLSWVRIAYATVTDVPPQGSREDYDAYWRKSDPQGMRATWAVLDRHHVKMILNNFAISPGWLREKRLAPEFHESFARWWVALAAYLEGQGIRPTYLELFNEPDGDWNGRVAPEEYRHVAALVRAELDARGLSEVGLIGPGLAHIDLGEADPWVEALDDKGLAALSAFSVHGYEWRDGKNIGAQYVRDCWSAGFGRSIAERDPQRTKPVFVTEFATLADTFAGAKPPVPSDTPAWAVRVFENALSFLNAGANALLYWQALDMAWDPQNLFGLVAVDGHERPTFHALRTLVPWIPLGARVLPIERQAEALYAAAFAHETRLVVAIANASSSAQSAQIHVRGAKALRIEKALRFGEGADSATTVADFAADPAGGCSTHATLAPVSTLTLVCEISK